MPTTVIVINDLLHQLHRRLHIFAEVNVIFSHMHRTFVSVKDRTTKRPKTVKKTEQEWMEGQWQSSGSREEIHNINTNFHDKLE